MDTGVLLLRVSIIFKHCVSLWRAVRPPPPEQLLKLLMLSGDALANAGWTDMKQQSYL